MVLPLAFTRREEKGRNDSRSGCCQNLRRAFENNSWRMRARKEREKWLHVTMAARILSTETLNHFYCVFVPLLCS